MTLSENQKLQVLLLLNEKRLKIQKQLSDIEKELYEHGSSICDHDTDHALQSMKQIVS